MGLSLNFDSPQEFTKLEIPQPGGETHAEKLLQMKAHLPGAKSLKKCLGFILHPATILEMVCRKTRDFEQVEGNYPRGVYHE